MFALPIAAAIVPALLLLWYFHSRDVYPEPPRVVWATFFLGVLSIPAILMVALPAKKLIVGISDPYGYGLAEAFVCAAIPEELFKYLVLTRYAARHKEFNEPMDGVIYGVAASLGFATLENILYVGSGGMGVAVMRALTAVPGHAFTGAVMGYFVGRARFAGAGGQGLFGLGLLVPILLHGMYDFPILTISAFEKLQPSGQPPATAGVLVMLTLLTLIIEWRLALQMVRRLRAEQEAGRSPQVPVPAEVVAPQKPTSLLGWVQVLLGGALTTIGGLLVLILALGAVSEHARDEVYKVVVGGAVLSVPPLLIGIPLFRAGIRRLNRAGAAATS